MNSRLFWSSLLVVSVPFALAGCGDEQPVETGAGAAEHGHEHGGAHGHTHGPDHTHEHQSGVWLRWPQDGFRVYEEVDFVFGTAVEDGRFALLVGRDAVPAGDMVSSGEGVHLLEAGVERHVLKLAAGEQTVTLQLIGDEGVSKGPEFATTAVFQVEDTPGDLGVWFEEPADGAVVKSPVKLRFGVGGLVVEPAGKAESLAYKMRGHHHVVIDGSPVPVGVVVPADDQHIHFGKGQTEAEIELPPGQHTLTMQFADAVHQSYGPRLSKTITVTVAE